MRIKGLFSALSQDIQPKIHNRVSESVLDRNTRTDKPIRFAVSILHRTTQNKQKSEGWCFFSHPADVEGFVCSFVRNLTSYFVVWYIS